MTKKFEYADPVYYCKVKKELKFEGFDWHVVGDGETTSLNNMKCELTKHEGSKPDCRSCDFRKKNEWVFNKARK